MEREINELELFNAWKGTCERTEIQKLLLSRWNSKRSDYSDVIFQGTENEKSVLDGVLNSLNIKGLYFCPEYYHCDAAFYYDENRVKSNPFSKSQYPRGLNETWISKIEIHFEHENVIHDSWEEIIQLQNIPGELNVLVTYPEEDSEENRKKILDIYLKNISNRDSRFLIIFGQKKSECQIDWIGYKLGKEKFIGVNEND